MNIKLQSLRLENFKGTTNQTVTFNGENASVYGDNATGKTSLYDAFSWVMFDKNSFGDTKFEVKPYGVERPTVDVTATLIIDTTTVELKKRLTETWSKKRGEEESTFSGHTQEFWINGIPKKAGEYKAYVDSIVTEETFKRLTNAQYLLNMKTADMRRVLIDMVSNITDTQISNGDGDIEHMLEIMYNKNCSVDDLLRLCKQNIALYKSEQDQVSPRIDEVRRTIDEIGAASFESLEKGLDEGNKYIVAVDTKLLSIKETLRSAQSVQKDIFATKLEMQEYKTSQLSRANESRVKDIELKASINGHKIGVEGQLLNLKQQLFNLDDAMKQVSVNQQALVFKYRELAAEKKLITEETFTAISAGSLACDKCGQLIPEKDIAQMNIDNELAYNTKKQIKVEAVDTLVSEIINKGNMEKTRKTNFELQQKALNEKIESLEEELVATTGQLNAISTRLMGNLEAREIDLSNDDTYNAMQSKLDSLLTVIYPSDEEQLKLSANRQKVVEQIDVIKAQLSRKGDKEKAENRIVELGNRGKELGGLIASEKSIQYQAERFIQLKAEKLEGTINAMFENLSFRLFETQINGGIKDDCTPMINGVEYKDASNSERIRGNLDIVNAMQKHQKIYPPVFVDNAEACTKFREMNCQVIKLIVSKWDDKLQTVANGQSYLMTQKQIDYIGEQERQQEIYEELNLNIESEE